MKDYLLVNTVDKLWSISFLEFFQHPFFHIGMVQANVTRSKAHRLIIPQTSCSQIASHDNNRVGEVHLATLAVRQLTIIQDLQENIENIWMRLFNLVKEQDRIRSVADLFRQLSSFFIAYIAWRRSIEATSREFLHVLTHIKADECRFVIKETFGQGLG